MDQGYVGLERRKSERTKDVLVVKYSSPETVKILLRIGGLELDSVMLDLSEGGMAVTSKYFVPSASAPLLKFVLLTRVISIEVRIANKNMIKAGGYRLGIQFEKISPQDKLTLSNFLKNVANREKTP